MGGRGEGELDAAATGGGRKGLGTPCWGGGTAYPGEVEGEAEQVLVI